MRSNNEEERNCSDAQQSPLWETFMSIRGRLIRYAAKRLDYDYHQAEDVVQDAFLKVYLRQSESPITHAPKYFYKTVRTLACDHSKKNAKFRTMVAEDEGEEKGFEDFIIDKIVAEEILNSLSDEEKVIILGRLRKSYSYKELGIMIGKKPDAVRMLFNRAMNKIIAQYQHNPSDCVGIEGYRDDIEEGEEAYEQRYTLGFDVSWTIISGMTWLSLKKTKFNATTYGYDGNMAWPSLKKTKTHMTNYSYDGADRWIHLGCTGSLARQYEQHNTNIQGFALYSPAQHSLGGCYASF